MNKKLPSATIKDVARKLGLAPSTVSRALNKPGRASAETVAQVRAAAGELGYIPYRAAGSLVSKRSRTIGAIVPTIDNAIFAQALHALQRQLNSHGYSLLLASTHYDPESEVSALQSLLEHGVDAIVMVGEVHHERVTHLLERTQIPFVNTWIYNVDSLSACIGFDNRAAMRRMANYLLDLGHRDFAMIAGVTQHNDRAAQRLAGLRDALQARGLELQPHRIVEQPYTIAAGRMALRTLLAQPDPPTIVVCGNDILAFGAIYEAAAMKVNVPQSLSISGFDDFELSSHIVPSLTTIRVPATDIGISAANYLVALLSDKNPPNHIELEAELIVRGSTVPPPPR
jgi:LacI family transcriptional regulator